MTKRPPKGKGAKAKLREFFIENVGKVPDSDTLRTVAGASGWGRRVSGLKNEEGMNIVTRNDLSELSVGQYKLISLKPIPSFERGISKEIRAYVLDRNGFTCQMCGAAAGEVHPYDMGRKTRLQVGNIVDKSMGGSDDYSNLRAVCSVCNEGASNLTLARPQAIKLLAQIRRAPISDQLDVLNWIVTKFPGQAKSLIEDL